MLREWLDTGLTDQVYKENTSAYVLNPDVGGEDLILQVLWQRQRTKTKQNQHKNQKKKNQKKPKQKHKKKKKKKREKQKHILVTSEFYFCSTNHQTYNTMQPKQCIPSHSAGIEKKELIHQFNWFSTCDCCSRSGVCCWCSSWLSSFWRLSIFFFCFCFCSFFRVFPLIFVCSIFRYVLFGCFFLVNFFPAAESSLVGVSN